MLTPVLQMLGGLTLLYLGAEGLIRGSVSLATRLGISKLIVGLTVVAFATSSPELVVALQAALQEHSGLVVGNVVGSNICNIALILGLAALIRPMEVHFKVLTMEVPILIAATGVALIFLLDTGLSRGQALVLAGLFAAYTLFRITAARREQPEPANNAAPPRGNLGIDLLLTAAGLGLLVWGADLMVDGAVSIGEQLGVPETIIGLTVVALGTSLPELAAGIVAAVKDEADILIGNVMGSNLFNLLLVLGVTGLVEPIQHSGIQRVDLFVMMALTLALIPVMMTSRRIRRLEGALLLASYAVYMGYLVLKQPLPMQ